MMVDLLARAAAWVPCAGADAPAPPRARTLPLELPPALAALRRARTAVAAHDPARALAALDEALAHDPTLGIARFSRAICLAQLGHDDEALAALDEAWATGADAAETRLRFARACLLDGAPQLGLRVLTELLASRPDLVDDVARDPAFAGLRDHPVFLQMSGQL